KRCQDKVRLEQLYGLDCRRIVDIELHRQLMTQPSELHMEPLGQGIEAVAEKQDAHDLDA
ncbi:MAG TPA: hypothetical protein DCG12_15175, partial [Planctomycetaceae bacterium]|nr:hypothetical protein [Planctomycetaceae bacterium]